MGTGPDFDTVVPGMVALDRDFGGAPTDVIYRRLRKQKTARKSVVRPPFSERLNSCKNKMPRIGIEPMTRGFSVRCSTD